MGKHKFTFIDLFAGVGGFHIAMHNYGGKCVFASEIDTSARKTYESNFRDDVPEVFEQGLFNQDITDEALSYKDIPDFDLLCAGFPCQAFSIAGYRHGFDDEKGRGNLFFNILGILKAKSPKVFLLENVKNLQTHDKGRTFQTICSKLTQLGYGLKAKVLNASDYGLHQNRERIYIVGVKNTWSGDPVPLPTEEEVLSYKKIELLLEKQNLGKILKFNFPEPEEGEFKRFFDVQPDVTKSIKTTLNGLSVEYYNPPKMMEKYFQKFEDRNDWEQFIYNGKEGHFKKAVNYINAKIRGEENTENWENWTKDQWSDLGYQNIYQWRRKYVRKNASGVAPTLTANMGTGGHNVPLIVCGISNGEKLVRKLTPEECFALQGMDKKYIQRISELKISNGQKYKQAGNSIPIVVVDKIAKEITKAIL